MRCVNGAEWELLESDPYNSTFSCTEHLSLMISVDTVEIHKADNPKEHCYFVASSVTDNLEKYCTCKQPKANAKYYGPHHDINCPLFQKDYQR